MKSTRQRKDKGELPGPSRYRDERVCAWFSGKIKGLGMKRETRLMEVCGTHTHAFRRYGLKKYVPGNVSLVSGPGCPVCVTPGERIDALVALSRMSGVTVATFGDMFRVPGSSSTLEKEKASGADVRVVYSPLESLKLALDNPERKIVFASVGFETTAPSAAATLLEAKKARAKNWFIFCANKLIPPAMKLLVSGTDADRKIDGFMCPGHVSAVIGAKPYGFLAKDHGIPCVITGFEPADMLEGIYMLLAQKAEGRSEVQIQYGRAVKPEGNREAVKLMEKVFEPASSEWRGIGVIPASGLVLRKAYESYDIEKNMGLQAVARPAGGEPSACICGDILKGIKTPSDCPLFGKACTPENPVGACMVSSEGTCSAHYRYG